MSATHVRHPWFHTFVAKRKVPASNAISSNSFPEDGGVADLALRPAKRRRCTTLERGFAHLSLSHTFPVTNAAENPEDLDMPMHSDVPGATSAVASHDLNKVELPTSVGEPAPIVDVRMRASTWYEPEPDRIVITELDSSSDEELDLNGEIREGAGLYVSPTLLNHIRSRAFDTSRKAILPAPTSQALVLFRPLQLSSVAGSPCTLQTNSSTSDVNNNTPAKENHMEEEIMDVEL